MYSGLGYNLSEIFTGVCPSWESCTLNLDDYEFYRADEFAGYEDPRCSDREFILSELQKIPFQYRARLMERYSKLFSEQAKVSMNQARREANTRLRESVININTKASLEAK